MRFLQCWNFNFLELLYLTAHTNFGNASRPFAHEFPKALNASLEDPNIIMEFLSEKFIANSAISDIQWPQYFSMAPLDFQGR